MSLLSSLRESAFWGDEVCLSCDATFPSGTGGPCEECGSDEVVTAETALAWFERSLPPDTDLE